MTKADGTDVGDLLISSNMAVSDRRPLYGSLTRDNSQPVTSSAAQPQSSQATPVSPAAPVSAAAANKGNLTVMYLHPSLAYSSIWKLYELSCSSVVHCENTV